MNVLGSHFAWKIFLRSPPLAWLLSSSESVRRKISVLHSMKRTECRRLIQRAFLVGGLRGVERGAASIWCWLRKGSLDPYFVNHSQPRVVKARLVFGKIEHEPGRWERGAFYIVVDVSRDVGVAAGSNGLKDVVFFVFWLGRCHLMD